MEENKTMKPEEAVNAEGRTGIPEETAGDPGETQILTEQLRGVLEEQKEEEIVDAKIRQGIHEAAEEFKNEAAKEFRNGQEQVRAENKAAEGFRQVPPQPQPQPQPQPNASQQYQNPYPYQNQYQYQNPYGYQNTAGGNNTMETKERREEAQAGAGSARERTGWWKIVMLVLTCVITLCFVLTTLFTGLGAGQLKRIADQGDQFSYEYPGMFEEDPFGNYGYGYDFDDDYDYGYGDEAEGFGSDITLKDILDFFGISEDSIDGYGDFINEPDGNSKGNNNGNGANQGGGSTPDSGQYRQNSISDWFGELFGAPEQEYEGSF